MEERKRKVHLSLKLICLIIVFFPLLVVSLAYYLVAIPISFCVGLFIVGYGLLNDTVSWRNLDKVLIESTPNWLKFLLSFWTNRREPMPAGGKKYLWNGKSMLYRYIRWHIRNPISDMNQFYFGIEPKSKEEIINNKFLEISVRNKYFPRYIIKFGELNFSLGWKSRGCFSIHLKK